MDKNACFTLEELQRGEIDAPQAIEQMYDMICLENGSEYARTMAAFTQPQRMVFAVEVYMQEVYNGGHDQFFYNSSGVVWRDALTGLEAIGAAEGAAILSRVIEKAGVVIPDDEQERKAWTEQLADGLFEEDDDAFYALETDLTALENAYIVAHAADFVHACGTDQPLLDELRAWYGKCSDCMLHPMYVRRLNELMDRPLTKGLVDYLCEKAISTKQWPELRFQHLRILLLNESARAFDLKQWYFDSWKRSRRLWLRLFYLRGYAMYATEQEIVPVMRRFCELLRKNHSEEDYACILSVGGLPYLAEQYGYPCFKQALETAEAEYGKINALLRGHWTLDEQLRPVSLINDAESMARLNAYLAKDNADMPAEPCRDAVHQDIISLEPGWRYSITITCMALQQAYPTVPTLSVPEGDGSYVMLDASRYPAAMAQIAKKSTKLSARLNTQMPAYFLVKSNSGKLQVTFQSWVTASGSMPQWRESTAHPSLKMTREVLAPNRIRYGCNAAAAENQHDCFVFTVEWTPVPDAVMQ